MATVTARRMISPPMVGVPAFFRCVCGPSSRICWVMLICRSHAIMAGAARNVTISAVSAASDVRKVIYRNTLKTELTSVSPYKSSYNMIFLQSPPIYVRLTPNASQTRSIRIPRDPLTRTTSSGIT